MFAHIFPVFCLQGIRLGVIIVIKMLIRHISIPKNSHLVSLAQPKEKEESEEQRDYHSYFTQTLNPEHPIQDIFSPHKEGLLHHPPRSQKTGDNRPQFSENYLAREEPQSWDEIEPDLLHSPKKQNYKFGKEADNFDHYAKTRKFNTSLLPSFSPQLNRNAYLRQENYEEPHTANITNFQYLHQQKDQEDAAIGNKHYNVVKNKEVYRTIEKFKSKNNSERQDSRLRSHKKYTFDPAKQAQGENISPRRLSVVEKDEDKKKLKLVPLITKNKEKPYVSNPSLNEKKRNAMPEEEEQPENSAILFQRQKAKSSYLRKTSEEQKAPEFKPQSQIHLINKYPKEKKPAIKDTAKISLEISYRTSISRVKEICSLNHLQRYSIIVKIPEIFSYPLFTGNEVQEQLFSKADEILKYLQITRKDISLKKYSNCIVIIAGNTGIVWHFNGKVYLGGWKHQILDEGVKQGVGLEWSPKKYVYYGEFSRNKREGAGIMKTSDGQLLCGIWRENQFIRSIAVDSQYIARENQA